MTTLLDSSVVIALLRLEHVHHHPVEAWFAARTASVATCPITQGALVRSAMQRDESMAAAIASLSSLLRLSDHEFWPDDIDFSRVATTGVHGHRQVTDAYLAQLARHHGGRVATLDRGFAALHSDVADLVPTA